MFFCAALVILMIIKFRFPNGKSIHQVIERRYGRPLLNLFRKFENFDLKIRKSLCDIEFLNVCLENELTPKYIYLYIFLHSSSCATLHPTVAMPCVCPCTGHPPRFTPRLLRPEPRELVRETPPYHRNAVGLPVHGASSRRYIKY